MLPPVLSSVKLVYANHGNQIALGIYGEAKEAIEYFSNMLYNYCGTNSDTHFLSSTFAYIYTSWDMLYTGLANYFFCTWAVDDNGDEAKRIRAWNACLVKAQRILDTIKLENFDIAL